MFAIIAVLKDCLNPVMPTLYTKSPYQAGIGRANGLRTIPVFFANWFKYYTVVNTNEHKRIKSLHYYKETLVNDLNILKSG